MIQSRANSSGGDQQLSDDMKKMGAPPKVIEEWLAKDEPELFKVHCENREIVELFCRVQTCWQFSSSGHMLGMDYTQSKIVMEAADQWPRLFDGLQVMEYAAVEAAAEGE